MALPFVIPKNHCCRDRGDHAGSTKEEEPGKIEEATEAGKKDTAKKESPHGHAIPFLPLVEGESGERISEDEEVADARCDEGAEDEEEIDDDQGHSEGRVNL